MISRWVHSAVLAALVLVIAPVPAQADSGFAPVDRPGPALSVPQDQLKAALSCHGDPGSEQQPVLLSPATSVTPEENYSWTYAKAFTEQDRFWCAVTMPDHTMGDIQVAGEHLVHSIREMHRLTGKRIAVLGHSQGGMSMRWALRFWPDVRPVVDDIIGMAPSNHGTEALKGCGPGATSCEPAVWQQLAGSEFMRALNSRAETFEGISYTVVYTRHDEVVTPPESSELNTGEGVITNVTTQDLCAANTSTHLLVGTIDPVTYALVVDALDHPGPADPARVDASVCGQPLMPHIDPASVDTYLRPLSAIPGLLSTALPGVNLVGAPSVDREPQLRCYVYAAGC
ncbi:esterase/lipase family protein [Saccharopolyspora endophytica]|uniref:Lipase n=1 Tax=Saccharopolyspora endophytica TaxID=543886 RepID=A0ABS5DF53_9PSEU|nr:lipase [Saccharopolyspora endophytica]MBQ0924927.1 lipase [Saccharopolyspora endophytica]